MDASFWSQFLRNTTWWFPEIRGTILGVPIIRTMIYWGLYWGTLILGNYHLTFMCPLLPGPTPGQMPSRGHS